MAVALTWRILYIGQASDPQYDQVLEEAEMDCSNPGQMKFVFNVSVFAPYLLTDFCSQGKAPDPSRLPESDVVGVTAVLLTCSYKDNQEFLRVGYYVNVEYDN